MKYFDSHTHTNIQPLTDQLDSIISTLNEQQIGMNIVGVDLNSSILAVKQSYLSNNFYASIGIHPTDILDDSLIESTIDQLRQLYLQNKDKIKCIGECGFDFYHNTTSKESQIKWFRAQAKLAIELNLILMIHVRDAFDLLLDELNKLDTSKLKIIIHCFTGNLDYALKFQALGCYLSIPGVVTFKNATELQNAIKAIDLNLMITETDAPFLTPVPFRGKTNYPYYVKYTNEFIAQLLNVDIDKLNKQLLNNVVKLFSIKL